MMMCVLSAGRECVQPGDYPANTCSICAYSHTLIPNTNPLMYSYTDTSPSLSGCLRLWLEQDTVCPTCRFSLSAELRTGSRRGGQEREEEEGEGVQGRLRRHRNWLLHFNGASIASWLPTFSVELHDDGVIGQDLADLHRGVGNIVTQPNSQCSTVPYIVGMDKSNLLLTCCCYTVSGHYRLVLSYLLLQAQRVHSMFPHVPLQAITLDLADTRSISLTVEHILNNAIYIPETGATGVNQPLNSISAHTSTQVTVSQPPESQAPASPLTDVAERSLGEEAGASWTETGQSTVRRRRGLSNGMTNSEDVDTQSSLIRDNQSGALPGDVAVVAQSRCKESAVGEDAMSFSSLQRRKRELLAKAKWSVLPVHVNLTS